MEDLVFKVDEFLAVLGTVLLAIQAIVNYFLSPEKAEKFNIIGKVLEFLAKTRSGLSAKIEDGISK